jgi:hypothetical protein
MTVDQEAKLTFLGIFPNCPFYRSAVIMSFTIALITLGTIGISFLNFWAALVYLLYSTIFYFLAMPLWHCQYCYYKVKETTKDGATVEKLVPLDQWKEVHLEKHIVCAKKWGYNFFIIWFIPIVLIVISFFLNVSLIAVISLIGFLAVLGGILVYTRRKVCTNCAIMEECHASF